MLHPSCCFRLSSRTTASAARRKIAMLGSTLLEFCSVTRSFR
ncbi:hypothetical protein L915_11359 [Phytophthora nicotianae]|uniref:Uncharacterized protein n=1 Tax=Phytophthora nicotianae TaxID=4792 RepID=W2GKK3_PHYNI|nr:hypothetical protein L915_11359 [Phytophthora nicotianae]